MLIATQTLFALHKTYQCFTRIGAVIVALVSFGAHSSVCAEHWPGLPSERQIAFNPLLRRLANPPSPRPIKSIDGLPNGFSTQGSRLLRLPINAGRAIRRANQRPLPENFGDDKTAPLNTEATFEFSEITELSVEKAS
jgi:hypothetical protein